MANMYDQPAQANFISTYVPVNFENLYKIGTTQANMIQQAADNFYNQLQKFGEFRSPSTIDTERYYDLTLNSAPIQGIIQEAVTNPNALKDPAFRARMNSALNGVDYRSLSLLRESADNLRQGLETRAKMQAAGQYNAGWDDSNIPMYDTLGSGQVFSDITPVKWMSANELSDPYFDSLKPSSLGSYTRNGIVYDRTGIDYNTLYGIASARFNDLVATPQGQKYYRDLLRNTNGNQEQAKQAFIGMIADSQRDRLLNVDSVNPVFLANLKASLANSGSRKKSGSDEVDPTNIPQRRDIWNATQANHIVRQVGGDYEKWLQGLKDPDLKQDIAVANETNTLTGQAKNQLIQVRAALSQDPNNQELQKNALILSAEIMGYENSNINNAMGSIARKVFKDAYGSLPDTVDISDKNYNPEKLLNAYNKALSSISVANDINSGDKGDRALMSGGQYVQIETDKGYKEDVYAYNNSQGMMTGPQMFDLVSGKGKRDVRRRDHVINSLLGDRYQDESFGFETALATGQFHDVQFQPGDKQISRDGRTFFNGKLYIPVDEINRVVGKGMGTFAPVPIAGVIPLTNVPWARQSTKSTLDQHYKGRVVTRKDSEGDDVEYYEIDGWKTSTLEGQPNDVNINAGQLQNLNSGTSAIRDDIYATRGRQLSLQ